MDALERLQMVRGRNSSSLGRDRKECLSVSSTWVLQNGTDGEKRRVASGDQQFVVPVRIVFLQAVTRIAELGHDPQWPFKSTTVAPP